KALTATEVFLVPAGLLAGIPSVRWKLFETSGRRMTSIIESEHGANGGRLHWREEYRVDVLRLDTQHRRMFEQANAILDAIKAGIGGPEIVPLFDAMAEYAHYHFGEEEALMLRHAYPETEGHRAHHALLSEQLQVMRQTFKDTPDPTQIDFLAFLQEWLVGHIQEDDKGYTRFLNDKGVY
ncbi:MAG: bacteriohemerythrin, partial [Magnetospirillum sp.]